MTYQDLTGLLGFNVPKAMVHAVAARLVGDGPEARREFWSCGGADFEAEVLRTLEGARRPRGRVAFQIGREAARAADGREFVFRRAIALETSHVFRTTWRVTFTEPTQAIEVEVGADDALRLAFVEEKYGARAFHTLVLAYAWRL